MNTAIITARSGSKSIINKNLQKIGNSSLLEITIQSAKTSTIFDRIILSTDIETTILDHMDDRHITIHHRPKKLASDTSQMQDVVHDILMKYHVADWVWLLQPTTPFRVKADYLNINKILDNGIMKSVISVFDVGSNHPNRMYTSKNDKIFPLRFTGFANKQDLPTVFQRSGHFYVFNSTDFLKHNSFYIKPCHGFNIDRNRSINIDDAYDLTMARLMVGAKLCKI